MKKIIIVGIFLLGIIFGGMGRWLVVDKLPEIQAYQDDQQEQRALEEMTYTGIVKAISDDQLIMLVTARAGEKVEHGEVINIQFTDETSFQQGMNFLNEPGSINAHVKPEMTVTVLMDQGKALAIYQEELLGNGSEDLTATNADNRNPLVSGNNG